MLAGCSSSLLSSRHHHQLRSDSSAVQLQEKHCSLHQKMGTQRFDLPCAFSKRDNPRVALSLDTAGDARSTTSCSFRQSNPVGPPSSQSLVAQAAPPWGAKIEADDNCLIWDRSRTSKRYRERVEEGEEEEETYLVRAKRTRTRTRSRTVVGTNQFVAGGDDLWFPQSIERPPLVEEEEEEKVFLVPNAASFPFLASSSNNTLVVGSFETERDLDNNNNNNNNSKSQSDSSSSSGTNGFSSSKPEIDPETAGCGVHYSSAISEVGGGSQGRHHSAEQGVELVDLLTSCAEAISYGNHEGVNYFLSRLGEQASPTAATPIHRVVAYFTEALALRVAKLWPHIFTITTPPRSRGELLDDDDGDASALRLLNHVSPIPKFLHFTLNERLLREFQGKDRVHIIDFDIKQGLQWPSLFQSLASRPNPPSHVRITGVGESRQDLQDTGVRLARLAEALNLPFEFHAVADRLEDVRLWMLHVKRDECVAVNCVLVMHKALSDEDSGGGGGGASMTDFLGLIRSTKPSILVMAEQEADHNKQSWEMRFANSLQYYSALFDSVHYSCLPEDSQARIKVEEMFAREIRNLVVCQGSDRFERHQSFNKWTQLLEDGGFRSGGAIGEREITHSRMILRMYSSSSNNYSVEKVGEGSDGLTLKWLDQPLYTVSAWTPTDVAGSSSTSQPS
ncbi:protein DWARF AND LOW-TILLERING-like [Typha angustifolia]|uniref:protein DWARF AND LOW-TILLERING-like n=1 Tax=Typha angustifolia TaxID=59011 RepID=UPI003C2E9E67